MVVLIINLLHISAARDDISPVASLHLCGFYFQLIVI